MMDFGTPTHPLRVTTAALAAETVCESRTLLLSVCLSCNYANMLIACVIDSENDAVRWRGGPPFQFWPSQRKHHNRGKVSAIVVKRALRAMMVIGHYISGFRLMVNGSIRLFFQIVASPFP